MRRFTQLVVELDRTTETRRKTAALRAYFEDAAPEDAVWAAFFLSGRRIPRAVPPALLRQWVGERAGLPAWIVDESYHAVGDLAETMALLLPETASSHDLPLHRWVTERLLPLKPLDEIEKRTQLFAAWDELDSDERFVWNKLITGQFRVGVSRSLVARALGEAAGVPQSVMAHRLMGEWTPDAAFFTRLLDPEHVTEPGKPYPFFLASPLEADPAELGPVDRWQIEWKWDGIRAQWIQRNRQALIWSRGEELMTDRFPELLEADCPWPEGTVVDGEILAWRENAPLPFTALQRRIGRKKVGKKLREDVPVVFMAYDLLEDHGEDIRHRTLRERRLRLEALLPSRAEGPVRLSSCVPAASWKEVASLRAESRRRGVEGFMLKDRDSAYGVGRVRGPWWKWKVDPFTVDAVLLYAQQGHGRRAGLYTDYTFGVWRNDELVTFAKAYSGLTDKEIRDVDRFVRRNTLERHGPVRVVKPELVFELSCEAIQPSPRHKSGIAVRFPRMTRWRKDKKPEEADTLDAVIALVPGIRSA